MNKVLRRTAIARLRYDCKKNDEVLHISRSISAQNQFGECHITAKGDFVQSGSLEDIMRSRYLLRDTETIGE